MEKSIEIFQLALGLSEPWQVKKVEFQQVENSLISQLHIWIDFERGAKWKSEDGSEHVAYDTIDKQWRHLKFFQHECYIHARVPRIRVSEKEICMVKVPWARLGSGFTLLFEAYQMLLIEQEMPVSSVAKTVKETQPRIWRVFNYWVQAAFAKQDLSKVTRIGVDETSSKRGHNYVTQFVDLDTHKTIYACVGKGAETFKEFAKHLTKRGGKVEQIEIVSMDMSPAFIGGCMQYLPAAQIVFDKFHLEKVLNEKLDELRRIERKNCLLLRKERYTLLHKNRNLSEKDRERLEGILMTYPIIGEAYGLKESFSDVFQYDTVERAEAYLKLWCEYALKSGIEPYKKFVQLLKAHWRGIMNYFVDKSVNNGILEGLNSKIQLAKRRARGFRNIDNFINMIYFTTGNIKLYYPHEML